MKLILIMLSFLFFTNCSYTNTKYAGNEIETSSVVTVKPKVINESAFENFYMSEKLEKELNKIQFTSTSYLRSNKFFLPLFYVQKHLDEDLGIYSKFFLALYFEILAKDQNK